MAIRTTVESKTTTYKPSRRRTAPLTPTMREALDKIRAAGKWFACNGISLPTVRALADAGEVVLDLTFSHGTSFPGAKSWAQSDWEARPVEKPAAADAATEAAAVLAAEPAPKTPTVALARALRRIGLAQGEDFRITGNYRRGERLSTFALVRSRRAHGLVAEHADRIEAELAAGPFGFTVSVYDFNGHPHALVTNAPVERVRESAPVAAEAVAPIPAPAPGAARRPAVEDVLDGIAAACRVLSTRATPAAEPAEGGPTIYRPGLGAELVALLLPLVHQIEDLPAGSAGHLAIAEALRSTMRATADEEQRKALRAGVAVAGFWHRHIPAPHGEATEPVRSHVENLSGEEFAALLGRMVDAQLLDYYQAADFFDQLDAELRAAADHSPAAGQQPPTRGAELVELLLAALPGDVLDNAAQQELMTDVVCDLFHAASPEQPEYEALRAGFRAVAGWSKHIAGARASVSVCAHVNALAGREFAELLGRMVDDEVTNTGQAESWFFDLGRELRDADHG